MKQQSIKKNYIYNTFSQILSLITPLITAPYTARIFGADGVGIQSYTQSVVSYFTLFAALGTASYGQREIAMHRDQKKTATKLFWEIELLSVCTTCVSLLVWIAMIIFTNGRLTPYYLVLTMNIIAVAVDISWFYGGFEQFKLIVTRSIAIRCIGLLVLFAIVREKNDLLLYIGLMAATGLLGNLSMWAYLPRFIVKISLNELTIKTHLKKTLVYFIPTIAISVYTVLDKTMIGIITKNTYENGYYEQTTKITKMVMALITSLNSIMGARMSYLYAEKRLQELRDRLIKSIDFVMLMGIPMVFGIVGIARNFVPWFFGDGYNKVIDLLYIYSPLIIIIGISNCLGGQYLTPSGQISRSSRAIIAGAVINLCFNVVLIPRFQSIGAAVASIIAEGVITVTYVHMCNEYMTWQVIWKCAWKRIIAAMLMLIGLILIGYGKIGSVTITLVQFVAGVILYFGTLFIIKDRTILFYLKMIIQKIKSPN